jgi:SAM-dependent methyltransferase
MLLMSNPHTSTTPSDWVCRWTHLIPDQRPGGPRALDLACGHGRHTRWLVRQGCHVTAVDRDAQALASLADLAPMARTLNADIENGDWPLTGQAFDAVVVTHYLWRPLWPQILASLAPGGVLIYETFAQGHATVGKPSRPDFLLQNGELLQVCSGLRIVAYEDGFLTGPDRFVQRICAVRPASALSDPPPRHLLRATG